MPENKMNKQYHRIRIRRAQSAISVSFKDETQTDPFWKDHEFQWYIPCNTGEDESVGWKCIHRPESLTQSDFYTIAGIIQCYHDLVMHRTRKDQIILLQELKKAVLEAEGDKPSCGNCAEEHCLHNGVCEKYKKIIGEE